MRQKKDNQREAGGLPQSLSVAFLFLMVSHGGLHVRDNHYVSKEAKLMKLAHFREDRSTLGVR